MLLLLLHDAMSAPRSGWNIVGRRDRDCIFSAGSRHVIPHWLTLNRQEKIKEGNEAVLSRETVAHH